MNIISKKNNIPKWIIIVSGLIGFFGFFVGSSLYLWPEAFIKDVDFTSDGVRYLANMWAARQISLGAILGFSAFRRSIPMLQVSLGAYGLMNVQDAIIGVQRGDFGLIIGASLFAIGPAYMIFRLRKLE